MNLVDVDKVSALHKACFNGHTDCARLLLLRGATVGLADRFGSTALHKAAFNGHSEICQLLLDFKADLTLFDGDGHTPVHLAASRQHEEALRTLLRSGGASLATVHARNDTKETPLHLAARAGTAACVTMLLAAGASPAALAGNGETSWAVARRFGHEEVAALLSPKEKEEKTSLPDDGAAVAVAEAAAVAAERVADAVVVDRWGFLGSQVLDKDEEAHKMKEIEREIKWVAMRNNWDRWEQRRLKKLKQRCLKGIPVRKQKHYFLLNFGEKKDSFRPFAWVRLSGAHALRASKPDNFYSELISRKEETPALEIIHRDLHRTFPDHVQFRAASGRDSLMRVLKAFSFYNPQIGYCQGMIIFFVSFFWLICVFTGMGFVAAMFLMYCVEEQVIFVTFLSPFHFSKT